MAILSKTSALKQDNLVILTKTFKNKNEYALSEEQVAYVEKQIKNEKKVISINQFNRFVFIVIAEDKKGSAHLKETLRRAASGITGGLNEHKKTSVIVSSSIDKKYTLAFL